jgi:Cu/Ag efflux pump CusA
MVRWIVDTSLRFRRLVVALAVGVLVVALVQLDKVPKDALPEFGPPTVEVQTEALGLSAAEVEQLITVPLEQDLLVGVAFLDEIHSVSLPGLSSVVMTFEPGTDLLDARQVVQERLTQAVGVGGLPAVAKTPQMIQPLSSASRVSMVRLTSSQLSPIEMSVLSRWVIAPRLLGVPGVANVSIWGNRDRQLQVLVDPQRLAAADVTLSQVVRTAGNALEVSPLSFLEASTPGTGGFIDGENQRLNIFHEQAIATPEELAQVPVEGAGAPLVLGDVTDVVEDHQPLIGDAVCTGGQSCLLLVVDRFPGATTPEVSAGVDSALDALRPGLAGLDMDTSVYRPATYVESSFGLIGWALLAGLVLLLLVLGAAFWDWRRLVVSAAAIAVSAATAVSVLLLRGTTVDLMVAAGLVLGLTAIVHDAATDAQLLAVRVRERGGNGLTATRAVAETAVELRATAFYAALVVTAAVVPFLLLHGQAGAFLPPIALSYLLAVAASMLVALVLTPVLGLLLLGRSGGPATAAPVLAALHRGWDAVAPRLLTRGRVAVAGAAGVAVSNRRRASSTPARLRAWCASPSCWAF